MFPYINLFLAGALVAVCTWTDLRTRSIYNRYTYSAIITALILCLADARYSYLYGSLIVIAMYLFFFLSGKMGGGDLKLAVALSLFIGAEPVILGSIAAAMGMMIWGFASTWYKSGQLLNGFFVAAGKLPGGEFPYGAIMGPGSFLLAIFDIIIKKSL